MMPLYLVNILWFTGIFVAGEIVAGIVFYFVRRRYEGKKIRGSASTLVKGILERFMIFLGLCCDLPTVIVFFGALKLGTRLKEHQDSKVSNDYFLIGNVISATIAIIDYVIFRHFAGN